MNQRVVLFLLNRHSKGQALCYKTTSKKILSQLSWFNPNQLVRLKFDIKASYYNSTHKSLLNSYPAYNIEKSMMIFLDKKAESLSFNTIRRYQIFIKALNLVLLKSLNLRGPTTACFDKDLKMIS
jgi:hypothetical protein